MKKSGEHIRVNFGQSPFVFDIDGMMSASNHISFPPNSSGSQSSTPLRVGSDGSGRVQGLGPEEVAILLDGVDDSDDMDDEPPPLGTPSPPTANNTSVPGFFWRRIERTGPLAADISGIQEQPIQEQPVQEQPVFSIASRSPQTSILLDRLRIQGRTRLLNNTEQHMLRIAASIDEHRASLLASRGQNRVIRWDRIAASERALDDLADRLSRETIPIPLAGAQTADEVPRPPHDDGSNPIVPIDPYRPPPPWASGNIVDPAWARNYRRLLDNQLQPVMALPPTSRNTLQDQIQNEVESDDPRIFGDDPGSDSSETENHWESFDQQRRAGNMPPPPPPILRSLPNPKDVFNRMTDVEKQQERKQIRQQIEKTSTANLAPPLSETDLIQSLVRSRFRAHPIVESANRDCIGPSIS